MLNMLRKAAKTWVAKILLLLLVASFGIWGVSRSLVSDTSDTVMSVGDQKISSSEFRLAYQRTLSDMSRRFGTQLTSEQARALGVESQVYSQLAAGAALDQLSKNMNIGLSEDRLASLIADDPAFKDASGKFSRQLFSTRLSNSGLNENDYIKERSKVAVRTQIVEATADGFTAPTVLIDALKKYRTESRGISYLLLTNANIDPVAAPSEDTLKTWFETVKSRYRAPEYRGLEYVKLEPSDIAAPASITDDAVRADYDRRKATYEIPGTRTIEQLPFENRKVADAAAEELASGTTFDQLVSDQGKTATDVLLGDFTKAQLPDPAIADAAFAVETEGTITPVIDGAFGPVILRITNIKNGRTRSFDEVKDEIRKELADAAAVEDILDVHDRFEDLRASGSSLDDVAKELNLKVEKVANVDAQGLDPDGKDVDLTAGAKLLSEAFQTEVGVEPLPINFGKDGYIWFEVTGIEPARDRTLEEVHDKAVADWTAEQQKTALGAKAENIKTRIQNGETMDAVAAELAIAVESKSGIQRGTDDPVLGSAAVSAAFSGPEGTVASAPGNDPTTQIVLKVTEVNDQPTTSVLNSDDQQSTTLANAAGDDILDQMVSGLQTKYGVSVNQNLAQQAIVR